tara:strand:- start:182 stop:406 length:225 start_codon:yes stop_codon:yes gene_type:complete
MSLKPASQGYGNAENVGIRYVYIGHWQPFSSLLLREGVVGAAWIHFASQADDVTRHLFFEQPIIGSVFTRRPSV